MSGDRGQLVYETRWEGHTLGPRGAAPAWDDLGEEGRAVWRRIVEKLDAATKPVDLADELAAIKARDAVIARAIPDESTALRVLDTAYERLKVLGFKPASYCPPDGKDRQFIEAGSTGIHIGRRDPDGAVWLYEAGDLWPSRPILFREIPTDDQTAQFIAESDAIEREEALRQENRRLRVALHDAIRRPLGVTPDSATEFYSQRMADEAEARRANGGRL